MNYAEWVLRFVSGGALILVVTLLAKTKFPMLSGLFVLFPAVTLVGYYFIGQSVEPAQLKNITLFSIYSLSITFIFLVAFYYFQTHYYYVYSLAYSIIIWFIGSAVFIYINSKILHIGT